MSAHPVESRHVVAPQDPARSAMRRLVIYGALTVWAAVCLAIGVYQLASPLLTLPAPAPADPVLHGGIAAHRRFHQLDRWLALHVVYDECKCSQRVLDRLLVEPRPPGIAERVILVTEHRAERSEWIAAIQAHGFELDVVTPDQLVADYAIEAAPL